ncbi:hypothetical protein E4T39_02626 [Aureobasidium subglaciale]|nr:hypothetical protein E4T39_02626 [Aureobasidium subglaciale]
MSGLQYLLQQNDLSHSIVKHGISEHATLQAPFSPPRITLVSPADLSIQSHFGTTAYTPDCTTQSSETLEQANKHPSSDFRPHSTGYKNGCRNHPHGGDNRTFFIPEKYPWHCVGKVHTPGGWRTGTMIGSRHVLTAAHGMFCQTEEQGGPSNCDWISFTPAYYNGRGSMGERRVVEVIMLSANDKHHQMMNGDADDDETTTAAAFDYVVLILADRVGDTLGWVGTGAYGADVHEHVPFQYLGYAMEMAMGEQPTVTSGGNLGIVEEVEFKGSRGLEGYMMADLGGFTPGLSGGPVWYFPQAASGPCVVGVGGWTRGAEAQREGIERDYEWATSNRA